MEPSFAGVQQAAALGVAGVAWLLALGFTAARAALVASLPLGLAVAAAFPPLSPLAAPALVVVAEVRCPPDVRARGGGMFKRGGEGGLWPLAIVAGFVVAVFATAVSWGVATRGFGLSGEPVQTALAASLVVGGLVAGFIMALLARRVAFLEGLWVTALYSLLPVVFAAPAQSLFTYGTAAAYFAVILLTALLILGLAVVVGGSFGFLFCGDGELDFGWGYEGFIGRRFLMGKGGDVVGTITVISVLAVAVGTMAMVVVMSVMNGFSTDLRSKIFGANAHLLVLKYGSDFTEYDDVARQTSAIAGVVGASPFVLNEVMVSSESNLTGALLKGIDTATIDGVTDLRKNVEKGELSHLATPEQIPVPRPLPSPGGATEAPGGAASAPGTAPPTPRTGQGALPTKPDAALDDAIARAAGGIGSVPALGIDKPLPGIVIGIEMAKNLKVFVGDVMNVVSPIGELGPTGPVPKARAFRVAAVFYSGMYEYDSKFVYIDLREAQDFFSLKGAATGVEYKLEDVDNVQAVARDIMRTLKGYPYRTKDWMEMNRNLFSALKLEKIAMFIILNFIVIVASFLIAAVVIVFVIEKSKEISILKTMGATDTSIMKIFVTYGITVGGLGTVVGIAGGIGVCWMIKTFGIGLDPDVYYITNLPVHVEPIEIALVGIAALGLSYLATIYPALLAARLKPVEGLRYE
ncbi:MAG: ABC transporter permease [Deltaproteobacteria bacterium]|nr:ABC transporter permease [Deltaproteobacteria bacterium]